MFIVENANMPGSYNQRCAGKININKRKWTPSIILLIYHWHKVIQLWSS